MKRIFTFAVVAMAAMSLMVSCGSEPAPVKKPSVVFEPGDRVKHMAFGEGEVISAKQMGSDIMYEVVFDNVGTKKLMATYAKLTKA